MCFVKLALPGLLMCTLVGCEGSGSAPYERAANSPVPADDKANARAEQEPAKNDARKQQAGEANVKAKEPTPRKIIYTGDMEVIVEDFDKASEELLRLIGEQKAYVESWDLRGERGLPRSGKWTVRVPEASFTTLVTAITKLGETLHNRSDSKDVSGAYYDMKERLKTFEVEEAGLRKHYDSKALTAKEGDLTAMRRELWELRAQIETMKGNLNRWDDQVEYATLVVSIRDRKDYVPPVVPNFGGSVGRAFHGSIDALVSLGKFLVLAVVAMAPWLLLVAVLGSPFWGRLLRAYRARKQIPIAARVTPTEQHE